MVTYFIATDIRWFRALVNRARVVGGAGYFSSGLTFSMATTRTSEIDGRSINGRPNGPYNNERLDLIAYTTCVFP